MFERPLKVRLYRNFYNDTIDVLLEEPHLSPHAGQEDRMIVTSMTLEKVERGKLIRPSFEMTDAYAQELFNELWQQGFRPKDGTGNSGHVAAVQYHLEDMRKLVFATNDSNDEKPE